MATKSRACDYQQRRHSNHLGPSENVFIVRFAQPVQTSRIRITTVRE